MRALLLVFAVFTAGCGSPVEELAPEFPHSHCAPAEYGATRCAADGQFLCEPSTAPCLPSETDGAGNCTVNRPEVVEHDVWVRISPACP